MNCENCGTEIGYYIYCGPGTGCGICKACYEAEPDKEEEEESEDE